MRAAALLTLVGACDAAAPTREPRRIVSTAPSTTEIAFALGVGARLVGVSDFCAYPPEAVRLPRVGPYLAPGVERILALRPDLVLLDDVQEDAARALAAASIRVLRLPLRTLGDVRAAARAVGRATGRASDAGALVARLDADLRAAPRLRGGPRVLVVIGRDPGTLRNLYAAGPGSYAGELLGLAGGVNALAEASVPYPKISVETVVTLRPDAILEVVDRGVGATGARADWSALASVPAVRDGRVVVTSEQLLTTPGPRAPIAVRALVTALDGSRAIP